MADTAVLEELFLSLQGEGAEVGRPQLFLRLGGCPLRCRYCDTPESWEPSPRFRLHLAGGAQERSNPVSAAELSSLLRELAASYGLEPSQLPLAVTGGEPLVQHEFLAAWLPTWPGPRMLETAGLWPERLAPLLPALDSVSLDWKLASTLDRGQALADPGGCLELLHGAGLRHWVKLVLTDSVAEDELDAALAAVEEAAPEAEVYLQPATPGHGAVRAPAADDLLRWSLRQGRRALRLRVLPQVHPMLGAR